MCDSATLKVGSAKIIQEHLGASHSTCIGRKLSTAHCSTVRACFTLNNNNGRSGLYCFTELEVWPLPLIVHLVELPTLD